MCAFCAVFVGIPHWTEIGTNAGEAERVTGGHDWRLDRAYRIKLVNSVIGYFGCKVEDWMADKYIVRSQRGTTEIVDYLPQVWKVVETISHKPVDPLDPDLLDALRANAPINRAPQTGHHKPGTTNRAP